MTSSSISFQNFLNVTPETTQPSRLQNAGPDFARTDRFSEHVFRRLGWTEPLNFGSLGSGNLGDLFARSQVLISLAAAFQSLQPIYPSSGTSGEIDQEEILQKMREQFSGFFLEELEKRIGIEIPKTLRQQVQVQEPGTNLNEDLNPLNLSVQYLAGSILPFIANSLQGTAAEKRDQIEIERIEVFQKIWDIMTSLRNILKAESSNIENAEKLIIANNLLFAKDMIKKIKTLVVISQGGFDRRFSYSQTLFIQANEIKSDIYKISDSHRKAIVKNSRLETLSKLVDDLLSVNEMIIALMTEHKQIMLVLESDIRNISSRKIVRGDVVNVPYNINDLAFVRDEDFEITRSPFYENSRPSYRLSGRSSVNAAATSFIDTTLNRRDVVTEVDEQVPTNHQYAGVAFASGADIQENTDIETRPIGDDYIGPITGTALEQMLDFIADSSGSPADFNFISPNGFIGKWFFSAQDLIFREYIKPGTSNAGMINDANWLGKDSISSRDDFLLAEDVQRNLIMSILRTEYAEITRSRIISSSASIPEQAAALVIARKFGRASLRRIESGDEPRDGADQDVLAFYQMVLAGIDPAVPQNEVTAAITNLGGTPAQATAALAASNTVPSSPAIFVPSSGAAVQYPHNTVTETESGHFVEFDDSPGAERINERHRTGTGYEIMPDGSRKVVVVGNGYKAVFGDDFILVSGNCTISVFGDCNINSSSNLNLRAAGDINISAGGNLNTNIFGQQNSLISGGKIETIAGDSVQNIGGFSSVNADGDVQIEGSSMAVVAREGDISVISAQKANIISPEVSISASGSFVVGAGDGIAMYSSGIEFGSSSFDVLASSFAVNATGMSLSGGTVDANVRHAALSGGTGPAVPIPDATSIDGLRFSETTSNVADIQDFADSIANFETFDTSVTQANARNSVPARRAVNAI